MASLAESLTSSVGKKVMMSLTGFFLVAFIIVHLAGNLQLFYGDNGFSFNTYAVFMTSFPLIKVISYVNYFLILYHAVLGIYLTVKNKKARPQNYVVSNYKSPFYKRYMAIFGVLIFIYIIIHLSDFWYKYHFESMPYTKYTVELTTNNVVSEAMPDSYTQDVKMVETFNEEAGTRTVIVRDLYKIVGYSFSNILVVLIYLVGMVALGFHLAHGFQSAFQSLGLRVARYRDIIEKAGFWIFGILIPIGYASMPIYFYLFK